MDQRRLLPLGVALAHHVGVSNRPRTRAVRTRRSTVPPQHLCASPYILLGNGDLLVSQQFGDLGGLSRRRQLEMPASPHPAWTRSVLALIVDHVLAIGAGSINGPDFLTRLIVDAGRLQNLHHIVTEKELRLEQPELCSTRAHTSTTRLVKRPVDSHVVRRVVDEELKTLASSPSTAGVLELDVHDTVPSTVHLRAPSSQ